MSPAAALPTRPEIESWSVDHLESAASRWRSEADKSEQLFGEHVRNLQSPGGTTWTGAAAEAAVERGHADLAVVRRQGDVLRDAGTIAANGAEDQRAMHRAVLDAISEAESDGFKVNDDLSVTDTHKTDKDGKAARQAAAQQHTEYIRWRAAQLIAGDDRIGQQLQTKAAELQGHKLDGHNGAQVQPMDYHDQPPTPDPTPPAPQNAQEVKDYLSDLSKGNNSRVKLVPNNSELQAVYDRLTGAATRSEQQGPIQWRVLPDGTRIGLTSESKTGGGDTIRIDYPGEPRNGTVHVDPSARSIYEPRSGGGVEGGSRGGEGGFRFGGGGQLERLPERSSEPGHGLEIYLPDAGPGGGKVGEVDGSHHEE